MLTRTAPTRVDPPPLPGARDVGAQRPFEDPLHLASHGEQAGRPLEVVAHAGEAAVVQLVAAVEGELEVVAVGVRLGGVRADHVLTPQSGEHRGGQRSAGARQRGRGDPGGWGPTEHGSPRARWGR